MEGGTVLPDLGWVEVGRRGRKGEGEPGGGEWRRLENWQPGGYSGKAMQQGPLCVPVTTYRVAVTRLIQQARGATGWPPKAQAAEVRQVQLLLLTGLGPGGRGPQGTLGVQLSQQETGGLAEAPHVPLQPPDLCPQLALLPARQA